MIINELERQAATLQGSPEKSTEGLPGLAGTASGGRNKAVVEAVVVHLTWPSHEILQGGAPVR